jgi:hypothetical protein
MSDSMSDPMFDYFPMCEVCHKEAGECVCPVCPRCDVQGDPKCYVEHGLKPGDFCD